MRFHLSAYPLLVVFPLVGCTQLIVPSSGHSGGGAIQVSISPQPQSLPSGVSVTLSAIVKNDKSHKGVNWILTSGGNACSPGCGTLTPIGSPSFSATYTPSPSQSPGSSIQVMITAQSVSNTSATDQITVKVVGPTISISVTGGFQTVTTAGPAVTLSATTNDAAGVNWTLTANGNPCSPYCGNLQSSSGQHLMAVYAPPPLLAAGTNPGATITATSITDSTKASSFTFSIIPAAASGYALLLRGYDSAGTPLAVAGVLVADGNGNITDGEFDVNDGGTATHLQSLQGEFGTDTDFAGIIRGTITITSAKFPGSSVNPVFKFVLRGTEAEARLIEFDPTGNLLAGTLLLQSGLSSQTPTGVFAFGLDSDAPVGGRTVEAGAFEITANGTLVGIADESQARSSLVQQAQTLAGTGEPPDSLGRGMIGMSLNGTSAQYVYYGVRQDQLYLLQIGGDASPNTVFSGTARAHAFDFDPVNGIFTTSVFQLTGVETPNSNSLAPDAVIGIVRPGTDNAAPMTCDINDAGAVAVGSPLAGTLASYDSNTGRAVFEIPNGNQNGLAGMLVVYYYENGEGFTIGEDTAANGVVSRGFSGTLVQQIHTNFSSQSISGPLIGVSGASSVATIPAVEAALGADPSGTLTGIAYANSVQGPLSNVSFQATFSDIDPVTGHASAHFPGGFYGDFTPQAIGAASLYLIGSNRFISIGTQQGTPTGVSYYSPD